MGDSANGLGEPREPPLAPFLTIWTGQAFSLLGSHLVQFALVWWLTKETGSATVLAVATMAAFVPGIIVGPFAGALVDRWNRRVVMIAADGIIALATLFLAALFALGIVQVWHVYAAIVVRATAGSFHWPAMQASTTLIVPERHLSRVAGLNQTLWGLCSIIAPPLGALLLSLLPTQGVLAIDVGTALVAIAPLLFLSVPQPARASAAGAARPSVLADVAEGLRLVWAWPGLMLVITGGAIIHLLLIPASALTPLIVTNHFGGGAAEFALLDASWGVGMVGGGLILGVWGGFRRRIVTALSAMALMGVGNAGVGLAPAQAIQLAVAGMFLFGLTLPMLNGSLTAILQATVPPATQGRVLTLLNSLSSLMIPVGLAAAGPVADALSPQFWYVAGGLSTTAMAVAGFFVPALMRLEEGRKGSDRPGTAVESAGRGNEYYR